MKLKDIILIVLLTTSLSGVAQDWQPKQAKLMSRFAKDVNPDKVLPEYPRPQLVRTKWLNLNGIWQFQAGVNSSEILPAGKLTGSILVPFPVESALSGVMEQHERVWYRKNFKVPASWTGQRVLLHFGAVDYEAEVFLNDKRLGVHTGGYDPFSFDITDAIKGNGNQELTVRVYDPTDAQGQPRGKQTLNPRGIMYTSTTGIWQTVWLEPVPVNNIKDIRITPDIDKSLVRLTVNTESKVSGNKVTVKVRDGKRIVQSIVADVNVEISIPIKNAKLWSPASPFLYDIDIALTNKNKVSDSVSSYFGMRKISIGVDQGVKKVLLNNKFVFQIGPLDQGFWPDGLYTAPTDEALRYDLEVTKALGFNMVRKHLKVEPYRWYYWADKIGLLVWQDMPSANSYTKKAPPVDTVAYAHELRRMVETHWNSPAIITWVVFNENQGQHNTEKLVNMVKDLDGSRLVNQGSGGGFFDAGDYLDIHSYPPPAVPVPSATQALANGEYGGIGYVIKDHVWRVSPTYIMVDNDKDYTDMYDEYATDLTFFKTQKGLSAAVYTETTDVEGELNGILTYDRAVIKGGIAKIKASNTKVINDKVYLTEVLPSSEIKPRNWKYTFDTPDENWFKSGFDDGKWKSALAGFGTKPRPFRAVPINTVWDTTDIWIRQEFKIDQDNIDTDNLVLYIHHDDECEVYINGIIAATRKNTNTGYVILPINDQARKAIKKNETNVIAIHSLQKKGGQYIDAGISVLKTVTEKK